jgi:hypothetical protein
MGLAMDSTEQTVWLQLHIPHRVRAALARLELLSEYLTTPTPGGPDLTKLSRDQNIRRRSEMNSVNEGRLAAIRWLIEFIGINSKRNDIVITDFGGNRFDENSPDGQTLEDIWLGVSKAASHATDEYGHPNVSETRLCEAMKIIVSHLQKEVYTPRNLELLKTALVPD